jgi:hypothetical protein
MDNQTKKEGQEYSNNVIDSMQDILNQLTSEDDNKHDKAVDKISNFGLSVSKQTIINYLISWGGPAYRIQIVLDEDNDLLEIKPQYQDWGTQWVTMETNEYQDKTLEEFIYNSFGYDFETLDYIQ